MTAWQFVLHLFNFVLPAFFMAVFMPLAGRWVMGPGGPPWLRRAVVQALCGVLVLVAGLVVYGHDGKMNTYLALLVLAASAEWAMHRGWSRR